MTEVEVMRERQMLIAWKESHGLTEAEQIRLEFLNQEALRLCPRVTKEMKERLDEMEQRIAK